MNDTSVAHDFFQALLQGLPPGVVYSLVALGFVLTYKTSGVFNLAFGAQAYVSAAMYFKARITWEWPTVPAVILAVFVLPPLIGLVLERLIFRPLRTAPAVARLVVAAGLAVAIPYLFDILAKFTAVAGETPVGVAPDGANVFYDPFGVYAFSRDELVSMGVVLVAVVGLVALFRFSAIGVRMRAVVESPKMTELNGIAADRISALSWVLSSFFAGIAGVLIAPRFNTLAAADFFSVMVVAIAAAAIGRLTSLPGALGGGILLGVVIAQLNTFLPRWSDDHAWVKTVQENLTPSVPFVVLFAVVVLVPSIRRSRDSGDPLAGVEPPPPSLGGEVRDPRLAMIIRLVGLAVLAVTATVVLTRGDSLWVFLVTKAVVMGIIFLSITVVTGMSGQISLCQGTFAAIGAFTVYQMVVRYDLSVLVAALIGAAVAAVVGALLSLPIRRLGGIWTAIATLAFAYFFDAVLVKLSWVGGGDEAVLQGTAVPRPVIGPWDLGDDKYYLVFASIVLVVVAAVVLQLRKGTFGRTLVAMRGSEVGAESIGISSARVRLIAFAVSAFIAGLGGALLAMAQKDVSYGTNFGPFAALFWVVMVVTLGSRTIRGALNAAAAFALFEPLILSGTFIAWIARSEDAVPDFFPITGNWVFVLFGLAALQFARHPEGLVERQMKLPAFLTNLLPTPTPALAGAGGVGAVGPAGPPAEPDAAVPDAATPAKPSAEAAAETPAAEAPAAAKSEETTATAEAPAAQAAPEEPVAPAPAPATPKSAEPAASAAENTTQPPATPPAASAAEGAGAATTSPEAGVSVRSGSNGESERPAASSPARTEDVVS
ncbi:ABC transporter permease [Parafrankia sp. EUN1f]|uniref:ABC transporter permease n=1 Tax=Parafrankia sp. EUN1f TaxID=102897 RepID=UPI0001C46D14|nr:ABC transporter permease [Parafrankia sp. EUN1f]EFC80153.1 inner-membrane translocator [Parafrankia sp. EUN1f]